MPRNYSKTNRHRRKRSTQRRFLQCYLDSGQVAEAARQAKIHPDTHYCWLKDDPEYAKKFRVDGTRDIQRLEDEAFRRAYEGIRRPVLNNGKQVYYDGQPLYVHVYSDRLLIRLLRARQPKKYKDNKVVTIDLGDWDGDLSKLSVPQLEAYWGEIDAAIRANKPTAVSQDSEPAPPASETAPPVSNDAAESAIETAAGSNRNASLQPRQRRLLSSFKACGQLTKAAKIARVSRSTHYLWLQRDGGYAAEFRRVEAEVVDMLEEEAIRRGKDGIPQPVVYKRELVGFRLKYSSALLIFLLKAWRPERYGECQQLTIDLKKWDGDLSKLLPAYRASLIKEMTVRVLAHAKSTGEPN